MSEIEAIHNMHSIIEMFKIESEIRQCKVQNQFEFALNLYDKLIELKNQGKIPNRLGLARSIVEKAFLLERLGRNIDALRHYQIAQQIVKETSHPSFMNTIIQRINALNTN